MKSRPANDSPLRVVLADDQPLGLDGVAMILDHQDDITVVGRARHGGEAVQMAVIEQPDVVCLDIEMPVMNGIEAAEKIVSATNAQVIMLTTFNREDYLISALNAGASGFLLKTSSPEQLIDAVHTVATGDALLAPEMTRAVIRHAVQGSQASAEAVRVSAPGVAAPGISAPGYHDAASGIVDPNNSPRPATGLHASTEARPSAAERAGLSERETEVLGRAALGLSNAEIGEELFIGTETVKSHVSNVLTKLGLRNRVQAVAFAYRNGLVPLDHE